MIKYILLASVLLFCGCVDDNKYPYEIIDNRGNRYLTNGWEYIDSLDTIRFRDNNGTLVTIHGNYTMRKYGKLENNIYEPNLVKPTATSNGR